MAFSDKGTTTGVLAVFAQTSRMRSIFVSCLILAAIVLSTKPALAYSTDVHFNLTYVEARLVGIDANDALWIALADESIDHNRTTSAYSGTIDTVFQLFGLHRYVWAHNGEAWQAYTDIGAPNSALDGVLTSTRYSSPALARAALNGRRDHLWNDAVATLAHGNSADRSSMIRADIALGVFLHYEQDYYGHRQFGPDLDGQNWVPFGTFRGHSAEGYATDYVALRPILAREMLATTYGYLMQWQARRNIKAPELPASLNATLINHISTAYDSRAMDYPNHRFRPWFPAQQALNTALSSALAANAASREWRTTLPNANDLKLQLPYDQPQTPLREVERRVGEPVLDNPHIPFSAVLPKELTAL